MATLRVTIGCASEKAMLLLIEQFGGAISDPTIGQIDDLATVRLSRDIARKLEESMKYPGQIKVTVIREVRAEEYAK